MLSVLPLDELSPFGLVHFRTRFKQSSCNLQDTAQIILKFISVPFCIIFFLIQVHFSCFLGLSPKMASYLFSHAVMANEPPNALTL